MMPIISAAIGSVERRFPHINMERNGISRLSRDRFSLISFYGRPLLCWERQVHALGYEKSERARTRVQSDRGESISVTIDCTQLATIPSSRDIYIGLAT